MITVLIYVRTTENTLQQNPAVEFDGLWANQKVTRILTLSSPFT